MPGNTEEQEINKPTNNQTEGYSEESHFAESVEKGIQKQVVEEMEVHHHPHVEKKSFKEYLLEGLMIFLAVTMGFFAENIREHFAEKSKEREFVISLSEDVISDTAQLHFLLPESETIYNKLDSLYSLLQAVAQGQPYDIHRLYYMNFAYGFGLFNFVPNNRTILQIKNTGGFSLIKNKGVRDSITLYDNYNESAIKLNSASYVEWMNDLNKMSQKIFYYDKVKTFAFGSNSCDFFLDNSLPLKLANNDKLLIIEYGNKVRSLMMIFDILILSEKKQFESSKNLTNLLKKEYDLRQ